MRKLHDEPTWKRMPFELLSSVFKKGEDLLDIKVERVPIT